MHIKDSLPKLNPKVGPIPLVDPIPMVDPIPTIGPILILIPTVGPMATMPIEKLPLTTVYRAIYSCCIHLITFYPGKRSISEDELAEVMAEEHDQGSDHGGDGMMDKKADNMAYSFGMGKRDPYAFGLGKRPSHDAPYAFGLGKRDPYAFGLGKRADPYQFGLGEKMTLIIFASLQLIILYFCRQEGPLPVWTW